VRRSQKGAVHEVNERDFKNPRNRYHLSYKRGMNSCERVNEITEDNLLGHYHVQVNRLNQMKQNLRDFHKGMNHDLKQRLVSSIRKVETQTIAMEKTLFKNQ
jgi:hypothetical protein